MVQKKPEKPAKRNNAADDDDAAIIASVRDDLEKARQVVSELRDQVLRDSEIVDVLERKNIALRDACAAVLAIEPQHVRDDGKRVVLLDTAMLDRLRSATA